LGKFGLLPPAKSRHPAGFPEAGTEPYSGRPVPPEDDTPEDDIAGDMDKFGMAPKTEQELEDLNVENLRIRLSSQMDGCGDDDGPDKYY